MAKLDDVGTAPNRRADERYEGVRLAVRGDEVEPRGVETAQLRSWRSFSRNAGGAVSQSQECFTSRFRFAWNS